MLITHYFWTYYSHLWAADDIFILTYYDSFDLHKNIIYLYFITIFITLESQGF
jgi:hypothetical protein